MTSKPLIGKEAPVFKAQAVIDGHKIIDDFSLKEFHNRKYVLLLFYPMDFTFVCPTELIAFQDRADDFARRNTEIVACSTDSIYTHLAWLRTPQNRRGIEGITFPLIADHSKTISMSYGVLAGKYQYNEHGDVEFCGIPVAYRGLFIIDREGIIRHMLVNDLPLGRSVDEAIRMIDALRHYEEDGEACPANWRREG